ncbi:MAG: DUF3868 domain-containing protein [Muribaculaceae bacterium]|nr:DUF3868 domain-containing protein [Muribaculaceae bacterium]
MKKLLSTVIVAIAALAASASNPIDNIKIDNIGVTRSEGNIALSMNIDLSDVDLKSTNEYVITPVIRSAVSDDSIAFEPITVSGRSLWYIHQRQNSPAFRAGQKDIIEYKSVAPDYAWVDNSKVLLSAQAQGCCKAPIGEPVEPEEVGHIYIPHYKPQFNYIQPVADSVKERHIEGRAYVDFPVNLITIYPNYRNNAYELSKIIATIDSVKNDSDITIRAISIKGFASPEGPYNNNIRLAKGRTEALKTYINNLYKFDQSLISTSYEPEDWEGLIQYVKGSNLTNREAILAIAENNKIEPDARNTRIQREFPEQYAFLLATVYPGLRHSDYRIDYNIRSYSTIEEILAVLNTAPQKLSLSEFYRAVATMEPGSDEYNEVFETAVRMYPNDPVANLNAANTAMAAGNYVAAKRYLDRAGDDPTAIYARGILAALQSDYQEAAGYFGQAARLKVADAPAALQSVQQILKYDGDGSSIPVKQN